MSRPIASVRITDEQRNFLDQMDEDFEFSHFVRDALDDERVRQAAGVCGVCGDLIYTHAHGWSNYSWSSPGGQHLGLDHGEQVDLCEEHSEEFMTAFEAALDDEPHEVPRLDYIEDGYHGDVKAYMLEQHAVMDAQPDSMYATDLIVERSAGGPAVYEIYLSIRDWLRDSDAVRNDGTAEVDFREVFSETRAFPRNLRVPEDGL